MLTERKVFLGCLTAVGLWAETLGAKPVDVIRPEDEAILEGVFVLDGQNEKQKRTSPMADGNGVVMKGARDATRIRAVPLNVTFGENTSALPSETPSSKDDKKDSSVKTSVDNAQNMTVEVNSGADLKNTMKTVVEGETQKTSAPVEKVEEKNVKTTAKTLNPPKADEKGESAENSNSAYSYQEEIRYTYPSKNEREQARKPLSEWYNPNLNAAVNRTQSVAAKPKDETFMQYRLAVSDCLDLRQDDLEMDKAMLRQGNMYNAAAYVSQTLEAVNACYENIGYDIIRVYYGDDPQVKERFARRIQDFYITGTDVNFNPKFCGDDCSLEAMIDAQLAKFAEFRTYLAQLLNERPSLQPLAAPMILASSQNSTSSVKNVEYDEDGGPFIDVPSADDTSVDVAPNRSSRSSSDYNSLPFRAPAQNDKNNRYELPEIM